MSEAGNLLEVEDPRVLRELVGDLSANLRLVNEILGVRVTVRGEGLEFRGQARHVQAASQLFGQFAELIAQGRTLHPAEVRDALRVAAHTPEADVGALLKDVLLYDRNRKPITARTENQHRYIEALRTRAVVFGVGPAGTGKTFLAMAAAVAAFQRGEVKRIILSRPAVEAGEKLGFLPGDLAQKVDPYLRPLFDALSDLIEPLELDRMWSRGVVEIAPLAFMRGRTLSDAFIVLDEAQNTTTEQMKMFLTRLGSGAHMVVNGDPSQIDLPRGVESGLDRAVRVFEQVQGLEIVRFGTIDVVRHPLVIAMIHAWDSHDRQGKKSDKP